MGALLEVNYFLCSPICTVQYNYVLYCAVLYNCTTVQSSTVRSNWTDNEVLLLTFLKEETLRKCHCLNRTTCTVLYSISGKVLCTLSPMGSNLAAEICHQILCLLSD